MKNLSVYLLAAFSVVFGIGLLRPAYAPSDIPVPAGDGPGNPGFYEQWHEMRQNADGVVPGNYLKNARAQDAAKAANGKVAASPIDNIAVLGPDNVGGRTRAFMIDVLDHDHLISGGISGGLWRSTDRGLNWTPINDQAQSLAVTSLSQDPNQPQDIYFSTGEVRGNSAGISGDGVYKSTDGGQTFAQLPSTAGNSDFERTWRVQCSPTQAGTLYVATRNGGLYRSIDAGANFTQVFDLPSSSEVSDVEVFPNGGVMIGVRTEGVYYSPTGASGSFTQMTSNLPTSGFRRVELDYCDSLPNVVYSLFEEDNGRNALGMWKSTDQGVTWNATGANPESTINYSFPWYCLFVAVKPDNSDYVITGGQQIAHTTDGGQSWNSSAGSHADYHQAVFDLDNPGIVYIGNDGGLYKYSALLMSAQPQDLNNDYNVTQFYTGAYFPANDIMGGTQDNGTWRSQAGAVTFDKISGGDGAFCAVSQQNPDLSFVSYQRGIIRRSNNSTAVNPNYSGILNELDGDNDGSVDEGAYFINPFAINLAEGTQVYFTTRDRIWRTTNSGDNWTPLMNVVGNSNTYIAGVSHDVNPTVYVGGRNNLFYRVDNAATASPGSEVDLGSSVPHGDFISSIQVYPNDASTAYVTFSTISSNPRIWRVTNGTTASPTWTSVSGDMPTNLPVNWLAMHPVYPDSILLAATDFGLYSSGNGGVNWERETALPNVPVFQVMIRPADLKVYAFTHGRGVWTADFPIPIAVDPADEAQFTLYPVPAQDRLKVRMDASQAAVTQWSVLNAQGQEVRSGGQSPKEIDVSGLAAGVYFMQVTTAEGMQRKAFTKQ